MADTHKEASENQRTKGDVQMSYESEDDWG